MKAHSVGRILLGAGAVVMASAFGVAGYGVYLQYFDARYANFSAEVEKQKQDVSSLKRGVKEHWESLRIKQPEGMEEVQAAELYLLRPDVFGYDKVADRELAYKVGNLLLERSELAQLRERKREYDVEENKFLLGAFFAFITGRLGIFSGLMTSKGATDEQAGYKKGKEPTPLP